MGLFGSSVKKSSTPPPAPPPKPFNSNPKSNNADLEALMLALYNEESRFNKKQESDVVTAKERHLSHKRICNQLKEIQENKPEQWEVINTENIYRWSLMIRTDSDTPFHNFAFMLFIEFPENYPDKPPKFVLAQPEKFFHPNISWKTGVICNRTFQKDRLVRVRDRVESFLNLLKHPNKDSSYNFAATKEIEKGYRNYYRLANYIYRGLEKNRE